LNTEEILRAISDSLNKTSVEVVTLNGRQAKIQFGYLKKRK